MLDGLVFIDRVLLCMTPNIFGDFHAAGVWSFHRKDLIMEFARGFGFERVVALAPFLLLNSYFLILTFPLLKVFRKSRPAWRCRGVSASPESQRSRLIATASRLRCQ